MRYYVSLYVIFFREMLVFEKLLINNTFRTRLPLYFYEISNLFLQLLKIDVLFENRTHFEKSKIFSEHVFPD